MNFRMIKRFLPGRMRASLRLFKARLSSAGLRFAASHPWVAGLYYTFFSRQFHREHMAVLQGRIHYGQNLSALKSSSALLRRNVHRLEKGLIMSPRRPSFAENFIQESVEIFVKATQTAHFDKEELKWASDVLTRYFDVVHDTPVIARARALFDASRSKECNDIKNHSFTPYPYGSLPEPQVSPSQLNTLFLRRRSVRWYKDQQVPWEILTQAVNMACLAPSACNRQPYRFDIANQPEKARDIAALAGGTPGWVHNVQCTIVVVGDLSAYFGEHDRHLIYIDASLATMQLMLALDTLGLASCPVNWPDIEYREKSMQAKLQLKNYERPIMLITVGYPLDEGGIPFSQKKDARILTRSIREES